MALRTRLAELVERHERLDVHLRGADGRLEDDPGDLGAWRAGDEVHEGLDAATLEQIGEIRMAIHRLARGTWGQCETCGARIDAGRLAAVPTARHCTKCKV